MQPTACLLICILTFVSVCFLGKSVGMHPDAISIQRRSLGTLAIADSKTLEEGESDDETAEAPGSISSDNTDSAIRRPKLKRTIVADMDGKTNLQKVIVAYGAAVAKVLGYSGNPAAAVAFPYFTDILVKLAGEEKNTNVWVQIEERLNERISADLSKWHFGNLLFHVNQLQHLMKRKNLTEDELEMHVLSRKEQFLPQTFERVGFNSMWTIALPAYVTYMSAVYLDMIKNKAIDKCSLGKKMKEIREDAIEAAKALFRARYRGLVGIRHSKGWPKRRSCRGLQCFFASWLEFKDEATGVEYAELMSDVEFYIFHTIQENTAKLVWENMIDKLNAFFDSSLCLCEDECPDPIDKSEVTFGYPRSCYGQKIDGDDACALPCHSYDEDKQWCPTKIPPRHNNLLGNDRMDCKKDRSMTECFPVKGAKIFTDI